MIELHVWCAKECTKERFYALWVRGVADRHRGIIAIFSYLNVDCMMQRRQCSCYALSGGQ